jgi:protein-S-isoprenylcysteine O-methyltransferase Ste14
VSTPPAADDAPPLTHVRRAPAWLIALGHQVFRTRDALFPVLLLALILLSEPFIDASPGSPRRSLDHFGVAVALAGQALRVAVIGYRYIVRGGRNRQVYADGLVTTGFFALSRNPLYLGNLVILAGLFLIWSSPLLYAVGGPLFLLGYRAIVAAEEEYLGGRYGREFDAYCEQVPRWWPSLGRLRQATRGMSFNWRRVVLKEYGSTAYWMAGALAILAYKEQLYARVQQRPERLLPYLAGIGAVALLWGYARYLKKSKRLREYDAQPAEGQA